MTTTPTTRSRTAGYVRDLVLAFELLDLDQLDRAADMVLSHLDDGRSILIAGNGGGSSVAEHMACDWRAAAWASGRDVGELSSLSENSALITAIANDFGYETVFERQVLQRGSAGDLLVCLSVSGTSPNILRAVEAARERGLGILSLVGRPGPLTELSDLCVLLDVDGDYGLTEDLQSLFVHMVSRALRQVDSHRVPGTDPTH